ncbi:hypothetical protein CXB51_018986 [Gossypium anomalum]|uniref:JAB1/MPN/MOV34 metalloenzyme domain-containing protein n=1 Tax=Gossypium anomalum TaxID=47600 RepID=A0A8J5YAU0_9ROSI|nr:hypothetical protein CXB51_018986 [Gossypium anomalum]
MGKEIPLLQAVSTPPQSKTDKHVIYSKDGNVTALIWGASPQSRSDRQKDQVEINPKQTTRFIGWYHSHPHITVLPSHVDVRTQAMYQLLDSGFIGLIFLVLVKIQTRSSVIDLESSLSSSENPLLTSGSAEVDSHMQDTSDSRPAQGSTKVQFMIVEVKICHISCYRIRTLKRAKVRR